MKENIVFFILTFQPILFISCLHGLYLKNYIIIIIIIKLSFPLFTKMTNEENQTRKNTFLSQNH